MKRRRLLASSACLALGTRMAHAADGTVKIGVLTDMSGPYSHQTGEGSVVGTKMAVDEFGGMVAGRRIVVVAADHQNKPDVASSIARQWIDTENVDVIVDLASSAPALAIQDLMRNKNKIVLFTGPATDRLTNEDCSPNGFHWVYDSYGNGRSLAKAVLDQGGKTWFFVGVDNAFGHALVEVMSRTIAAGGGKILGSIFHPFGSNDFSAFVLTAQQSGADVIAFANSGTDFIRSVKQAREYGITNDRPRIVGPVMTSLDIQAIGPEDAQGIEFIEAFFWDRDDASRRLAANFSKRTGSYPGMAHVGAYSAVRSYLKAVQATGTTNTDVVLKVLHDTTVSDDFAPDGVVRADGRMSHELYLLKAKGPKDNSVGRWDVATLVARVPGRDAFRPLSESSCALVKR